MSLARHGFVSYKEADGFLSASLHHGIFETARGELCFLTSTGSHGFIQRLRGERFTVTEINFPKHAVGGSFDLHGGLQDRAGEWWFATGEGLVRFSSRARVEDLSRLNPNAVYTSTDGLAANFIHQISQDARGGLWIVTVSGGSAGELRLNRWDCSSRTLSGYAAGKGISLVKGDIPTAFAEDPSQNLWIGFRDHGALLRYRRGRFEPFPAPPGTIQGRVNALRVDRLGRLWMANTLWTDKRVQVDREFAKALKAMPSGAVRSAPFQDDPDAARPHITHYTSDDGLSSNEILCLTEDQWGRIYAGTNRGVDRLDAERGSFMRYTTDDGLSGGSVWDAYRDRLGALWFATDRGISRLIPAPDPVPFASPILITHLWAMGVPQPVSELGETSVEKLKLAPGQNEVRIEFAGLDFRPGGTLRYQYQLEGADRDWSAPTAERTVFYAHLASGTYRFLVRAVNSNGIASVRPASVAFMILPPLWQRTWFLALALLAASGMAWTAHCFRVRRLLEVERLRTRIATDLHDDIGSSLSQIAVLTEVIRQAGPDEPVTEPLTTMGNLSRDLLNSMNDIVWAINPKRDYLADLTSRMRRFAADALTPRGIDFRFAAPDGQDDTRLGGDLRREIFLIFKESVNNIVRHSRCSQAAVQFLMQGAYIRLTVSDNGKGFDPARPDEGNGLANMRLRAARLGGALDIAAGNGAGVTVTLTVPLSRRRLN